MREAVDSIARNTAKLKPKHIKRLNGEIVPLPDQVEKVLQVHPNPRMNAFDFFYKLVTSLLIDNNAFAYPVWRGAALEAVIPIDYTSLEVFETPDGEVFIRFYRPDGMLFVLPYDEVIHLRRHYFGGEMLGEDNKPINSILQAIHAANEGIPNAIKSSARLRGLLKMTGTLMEEHVKDIRDRFVSEYMNLDNNGGVAAIDGKADYIELKSNPVIVDSEQMKELRTSVYRYFGVNEKIIMSRYDENDWDSFYESTIEPIALQLSLEFTSKLFTSNERKHGHEIIFEANRLQYASAKTKVSLIREMTPLGLLTQNEAREIFNLAPIEGGDKRLCSLNYVDADLADQYQLGKLTKGGETNDTKAGN